MVQWVECSGPGNPSSSVPPAPAWRWQHWPVVPRCRGSEDVKVTDILLAAAASVRVMFYLATTLVIDTLCPVTVTLVTCTLTLATNHREQWIAYRSYCYYDADAGSRKLSCSLSLLLHWCHCQPRTRDRDIKLSRRSFCSPKSPCNILL